MKMSSTTEEGVITSPTCRRASNSQKLIRGSSKSKENMILPIAKIESHNSVPKNMTSPTKKTKTMELPTSKPKSPAYPYKPKAANKEWKNPKPSPTPGKPSSTILPPLQKVICPPKCLAKENPMTPNWTQTNFTPTKMKKNFSKESKKWNNPYSTVIIPPSNNLKWEAQHFIQSDNPGPDLDSTIQIKLLRRTELITLIKSTRKSKEFLSAWTKMKKLGFHQELITTKGVKLIFWEIMIKRSMPGRLQEHQWKMLSHHQLWEEKASGLKDIRDPKFLTKFKLTDNLGNNLERSKQKKLKMMINGKSYQVSFKNMSLKISWDTKKPTISQKKLKNRYQHPQTLKASLTISENNEPVIKNLLISRDQLNSSAETTAQQMQEIFAQGASSIHKLQSKKLVIDPCIQEIWLAKRIMKWKAEKNLMMKLAVFKRKSNNSKRKKSALV